MASVVQLMMAQLKEAPKGDTHLHRSTQATVDESSTSSGKDEITMVDVDTKPDKKRRRSESTSTVMVSSKHTATDFDKDKCALSTS